MDVSRKDEAMEGCMPPHGKMGSGHLRDAVKSSGVQLAASVVWRGKGDNPFFHEEKVGENHVFEYPLSLLIGANASWGLRTPILHPAVAAIDATQAGVDEAYLRALQNVDLMIGGRREDTGGLIRNVVTKYARIQYNPVRVLYRAAALWMVLAKTELNSNDPIEYRATGVPYAPRRIGDLVSYANLCSAQSRDHMDLLYVKCDDPAEGYMVEVLQALCSKAFPVATNMVIKQIWPGLAGASVCYSSLQAHANLSGAFSLTELIDTMDRFCSVFDCFDLWAEALQTVQVLVCRPHDAGVIAGAHALRLELPISDMRIGALGPLLAGITAEGMRSERFAMPSGREMLYGAAVKGVFVSAGFYQAAQAVADSHPIIVETNQADRRHYAVLTRAQTVGPFWEKNVGQIVKEAGWDCITPGISGLCIAAVRDYPKRLFRAHHSMWWTGALMHLGKTAKEFLSEWAAPARLVGRPEANAWHAYSEIGDVKPGQVASLIRWAGAKVTYSHVRLPTYLRAYQLSTGNINRFLPNLSPHIKAKSGGQFRACVWFPRDIHKCLSFTEQLGAAESFVYRGYTDTHLDETLEILEEAPAPSSGGDDADFMPPLIGAFAPAPREKIDTAEVVALPGDVTNVVLDAESTAPREDEQAPVDERTEASNEAVDWEQVSKALTRCGLTIGVDQLKAAKTAPLDPRSPPQAQAARILSDRKLVTTDVQGEDPDAQIHKLEAYAAACDRLVSHSPDDATTSKIFDNRHYARNQAASLRRALVPKEGWRERSGEEPAQALIEGVQAGGVETGQLPQVPDDPDGKEVTLQDFGVATLPVDSTPGESAAASVAAPIHSLRNIGFAPPEPSLA